MTPPSGEAPAGALGLSRWLALEVLDERRAVVFHSVTQARMELSRPLYDLLLRFRSPRTVEQAVGGDVPARLRPLLARLREKGFLVDPADDRGDDAPYHERRLAPPVHTLFRCPRWRPGDAAPDVVVLGVPSDAGSPGIPGSREAPAEIRRRSGDYDYRLEIESGRPLGWFEVEAGERVLEGVTIADLGDVVVVPGEDPASLRARIRGECEGILARGSFPVLLGGDHTTAFPLVEALAARGELAVLYLDAHTDFDPTIPEPLLSHNCLALRLWRLPGVRRLVQVGHRAFALRDKARVAPPGVELVTVPRLRREGVAALAASLPEDVSCHVSIDVNVLDPAVAPGTSRTSPGGLDLAEAKDVLRWLGRNRAVVGLDLVEVNPARDQGFVTSIVACHLLLSALGAVFAGRRDEAGGRLAREAAIAAVE